MKKIFFTLSLLYFITSGRINAQNKLAVIPQPVSVTQHNGQYILNRLIQIESSGFKQLPNILETFARQALKAANEKNTGTGSRLELKLKHDLPLPEEGYQLSIQNSGIRITAKSEKGIFYGLQTLVQLIEEEGKQYRLPFVEIEDYPRYAYRGLHLDVGRHMFPVSFIKSYIDVIAQYKLNTFHWHLTEDQGWRIEIKKYPKLTAVGGFREQTLIGRRKSLPQVYDGTPYGGFYTQEEVKEVIAYAASKYITVIPEIEMPGHSLAALSAYPELGCGDNPGPYKTAQTWGIFEDVYCAGKENTFKFLTDVLDEVIALFPSKYIHIGGDECPKEKWKECSYCQKRIKKEKLKDEHELQAYFVQRIEKYLNKKGRQIIGWDEILEGGLAPNATVMSWRGSKGGIAAASQNHNVIMTANTHLYLDYRESKSLEEPIAIGGYLPMHQVYSFNPTPSELKPEQHKYILGVQANLWTEYIKTPEKVWYMLLPRLYALSEISWSPLEKKNWTDFSENRVPVHLQKLDAQGVRFRVPEPIGAKDTTLIGEQFTLDYKNPVKGAEIYYTINGYIPYEMDFLYKEPLKITVPAGEERIIRSVVITPSGKRSVVVKTILSNKGAK